MHIAGEDGVAITLTALCWQFPPGAGEGDDAWLIITGNVDLGNRQWAFEDPCLEMEEARELARWLCDAGKGRITPPPQHDDEAPEPTLRFLEPALGFTVYKHDENELTVRVFLAAEAAPPWLRNHDAHHARQVVDLQMPTDRLLAAAAGWSQELNALPPRPWVDPK
ncbi:hypothetical protein [Actinoplanes sp. NPDC051411]|uniref:WapI family immunity protein n=1 Tax=Actinoplanes sp. NPDC051411 TaxID=3155522 RepID=UPI0034488744